MPRMLEHDSVRTVRRRKRAVKVPKSQDREERQSYPESVIRLGQRH